MRLPSMVAGILYLLIGGLLVLSAVEMQDSVGRNAIFGSVFAAIGAVLLVVAARGRSRIWSVAGVVVGVVFLLGLPAGSGAAFRVFVEGHAVFG